MMRYILILWVLSLCCAQAETDGLLTTVYINPNSSEQFRDIAHYTLEDGSPAIDVVCLFGANYAADEKPFLRANNNQPKTEKPFNENIQKVLEDGSVKYLQDKGILVLLSILNGHQPVGWSQFESKEKARAFAAYLKTDVVEKYGLDGIDIDDEYSTGKANKTSLIMVTSIMQELMPDKLITKPLFTDLPYFESEWEDRSLAQNLNYGWEMSYGGNAEERLKRYTKFGMKKDRLSLGFWSGQPSANLKKDVRWLRSRGYAGIMVFAFEEKANRDLMGELINYWLGKGNWNHAN